MIGPVAVGDVIIPSGRQDGTGVARADEALSDAERRVSVGVAWEESKDESEKRVNVYVEQNKRGWNGHERMRQL